MTDQGIPSNTELIPEGNNSLLPMLEGGLENDLDISGFLDETHDSALQAIDDIDLEGHLVETPYDAHLQGREAFQKRQKRIEGLRALSKVGLNKKEQKAAGLVLDALETGELSEMGIESADQLAKAAAGNKALADFLSGVYSLEGRLSMLSPVLSSARESWIKMTPAEQAQAIEDAFSITNRGVEIALDGNYMPPMVPSPFTPVRWAAQSMRFGRGLTSKVGLTQMPVSKLHSSELTRLILNGTFPTDEKVVKILLEKLANKKGLMKMGGYALSLAALACGQPELIKPINDAIKVGATIEDSKIKARLQNRADAANNNKHFEEEGDEPLVIEIAA